MTLSERVEALSGPDREVDREIALASGAYVEGRDHPGMLASNSSPQVFGYYCPPYTASLDAVLTLLPDGHGWKVGCDKDGQPYADVWSHWQCIGNNRSTAPTPCLALLVALLKARGL